MPPLVLMLVGVEKEIEPFKEAVEACKKTIGPMRVFSAHKAVDAVSKLSTIFQSCGTCHGVLMSHHFTAKGKEEYSDAIRKVMRDKYPTVPIVCWGNVRKGGDQGKDFHHGLDWAPANGTGPIAPVLVMLRNGEIKAEYSGKHHARKSVDKGKKSEEEPRQSLDKEPTAAPLRRKSMEGGPAMSSSTNRKSMEGGVASNPARRLSIDAMAQAPARRRSIDGESNNASPRGSFDISRNPSAMNMGMGASYRGMSGLGMSPMGGIGMSGMTPMTGMNMNVMSPMSGMGANGMSPMSGMGMMPMTGMGMSGMMPMADMGMSGMTSMGSMSNLGLGSPASFSGGMAPGMTTGAMLGGMGNTAMGMGSMGAYSTAGMGYNTVDGNMGMMGNMPMQGQMGQMTATAGMPAAAAGQSQTGSGDGGSNAELIRALADEVSRLKMLVEEKKARQQMQGMSAVGTGAAAGGMGMGMGFDGMTQVPGMGMSMGPM